MGWECLIHSTDINNCIHIYQSEYITSHDELTEEQKNTIEDYEHLRNKVYLHYIFEEMNYKGRYWNFMSFNLYNQEVIFY
jgi:hypothetical protein